jgi:hypothetical protein
MGEVLPDQAHDSNMASFKSELLFARTVFSVNGIVNRRKDSQIQA